MIHRFIPMILLYLIATQAFANNGEYQTYQVNGNVYEGYYIKTGDHLPFVILFHDWDGLTDYEIKRSHMIADLGYNVFAADVFGQGVRPTRVIDKRQHTGELYEDRTKMRRLLQAALDHVTSLGATINQSVAIGYCFGGSAVLELARSGAGLPGFVTFHGGLATPDGQDYSQTKGALLILHGSADTAISLAQFASLGQQLESAGVAHEMTSYGGAQHAFTVFDGDRYNAHADQLSWQRLVQFLNTHLPSAVIK